MKSAYSAVDTPATQFFDPESFENNVRNIVDEKNFFLFSDWEKNFGINFKNELIFPDKSILSYLEKQCPFSRNRKKVRDTHFLFVLPSVFSDESLTVKTWQKIFPVNKYPCFSEQNYFHNGSFLELYPFAFSEIARYNFFLMYKGMIPNSGDKIWSEQKEIIPLTYEVPKLVEVVPLFFLSWLKDKNNYFMAEKFGRISDSLKDGNYLRVGSFNGHGLHILFFNNIYNLKTVGLFLFKKFE